MQREGIQDPSGLAGIKTTSAFIENPTYLIVWGVDLN